MSKIKLFLASSSELKEDRKEFEIFINRKNKTWTDRGAFLELILWEDFLDTMSQTRLQDEYNQAIRECEIFVMLFFTKVGQYTEEEFETAFHQFQATQKPFIFTYFKDPDISTGSANKKDLTSLRAFQEKLDALGHFYTRYKNIDELKLHFSQQLDKLVANGFIAFKPDKEIEAPGGDTYLAQLNDSGVIAQGKGAIAVGAGGVHVGGNNTGDINTGPKIDTGGGAYFGGNVNTGGGDIVGRDQITHGLSTGDLEALFAPLLRAIAQQAPNDQRAEAVEQAEELKAEVAKGRDANENKMIRIVDDLVAMIPGAIGTIVSLFSTSVLKDVAGKATKCVLDKLKGS